MLFYIGALTSKTYSFMGRAWELEKLETVDYYNSFGMPIYVEMATLVIIRILPRIIKFNYSEWISDLVRFNYDSIKLQRILNIYEKRKILLFNEIFFFYENINYLNLYFYFFFLKNLQYFIDKQ